MNSNPFTMESTEPGCKRVFLLPSGRCLSLTVSENKTSVTVKESDGSISQIFYELLEDDKWIAHNP